MYKIQALDGKRWFIWTLVFLVASGIALVSYISFTGDDTIAPWPVHIRHTQKPVEQSTKQSSQSKTSTHSTAHADGGLKIR